MHKYTNYAILVFALCVGFVVVIAGYRIPQLKEPKIETRSTGVCSKWEATPTTTANVQPKCLQFETERVIICPDNYVAMARQGDEAALNKQGVKKYICVKF